MSPQTPQRSSGSLPAGTSEQGLSLADRIRLEGLDEGQRKLVLRLLGWRFGALSPEVEQRVASADMDQLQDWAMRLLDARTLDEVLNGA